MKPVLILLSVFLFSVNVTGQIISAEQNLIYNSNINPKYNANLNPKFNANINIRYNSNINPKYSSSINPKYASDLNPNYNSSINPKYNSVLNPNYNSSINPKYVLDLNPFKGNWTGKYVFDQAGNMTGILTKANHNVYLFYDGDGEWIGYFVRAKTNFNLFNLDGAWTGQYLCSDSESGYNLFNENGEWTTKYVK